VIVGVSLAERYREICLTDSDIKDHLPTLVDLVVEHDARHVVELGTRTGVSTIAFLYALEQTGGKLTSVDIDRKPSIGDYPHWEFEQGDDLEVFASIEPADIVFIDTSHDYRHTLRELNLYVNLVRRPGLIVLHDTELRNPIGVAPRPEWPVKRAVEEFCGDEGYKWTNNPACWGLAVIRID